MFAYRLTEQVASDRLADRRAQADARRRAKLAATARQRWTVLPTQRRRRAAVQPRFRSC